MILTLNDLILKSNNSNTAGGTNHAKKFGQIQVIGILVKVPNSAPSNYFEQL